MVATFNIPDYRMDEFKTKIQKLNKRAKKLGVAEITYEMTGEIDRKFHENPLTGKLFRPMVVRCYTVVINGLEVKLSGWSFLARIDHEPKNVNIINALPGVELDTKYRTSGNICEHCNINRYRKASYVIRHHESGLEKQVGSTCLKDFLGDKTPENIAAHCEVIFSFVKEISDEERYWFGGEQVYRYDTEDLLLVTSAIIRKFGWVSATKARENDLYSTAGAIIDYYKEDSKQGQTLRKEAVVNEDDHEVVEKSLEWIRDNDDTSDYIHNLKSVCSQTSVDVKHLGFAVSLIAAYRKATEQKREKRGVSEWVGELKKRMTLKNVEVIGVSCTEGYYGTTYIFRFLANGKDKLTWFASHNQSLNQGDVVDLTFTVKKHDYYNNEFVTLINRASF